MRFIKKTSEYQDVYRRHFKVQGKYFTVLYKFHGEHAESAVGIVIKRKVGKAVVRNKIKRRIRAYLHKDRLPPNLSAVIIARDNASDAGWQDINEDLDNCLKQIENQKSRIQQP